MKRYLNYSLLLIILIAVISYGIEIRKHKIFPYEYLRKVHLYLNLDTRGLWSIGVYEGATPFNLSAPENIFNPVLTAKDVDDIDASFVADPFMLLKNRKYFLS